MDIIHCRNCCWFAPIEDYPEALQFHLLLQEKLGDILPPREENVGICRKVTFSKDRPVWTHEGGYCHRAEQSEEE